ncbi:DUF7500 family protein [Halobaculum lipolyticum]|uniref:DUF7500 family protein n=1 Tax=Halobaculum lipolyticum TaxID=3032001 RepID=UPI0024C2D344|nr:hypothetical protein [Halobaculum sp. DT31]
MSDADDSEAPAEDRGGDGPTRDVVRVDGADGADESDGDDGGDDGPPVGRDGVMDPEDLDIRDRDEVDETDDGRYVISTGGGRDDLPDTRSSPAADPAASETAQPPAATASASASATPPDATPERSETAAADAGDAGDEPDPLAAVAAELGTLSSSHGFALAVAAGGETDTLRVASADATDTLATALRWYARRVNPGEPPEETIRTLLADSDLDLDAA